MYKNAGVPLKFTGEYDGKKVQEGIKRTFKDIEEEQKKSFERMKKMMADAAKSSKYGGSDQATFKATNDQAAATKSLTARQREAIETMRAEREAKLATIAAIRDARVAIEEEKKAIQTAKVEYEQGRKSLNDYRLAVLKANQAAKERAKAEREARKALNENSQYQQLNKALGELRRQSKDVLAEMFRLEGQGKKNTIAYKQLADQARGLVAQTQYLDKGLKKIDASLGLHQRNVGNYRSALDALSPMFAQLNGQLAAMGINITELSGSKNVFRELGAQFAILGKQALMFLVSPIGLIITSLASLYALIRGNANTVIQFNAGLLNVSKTTGIAGAQLDKLGDSLIGLSRRLEVVGTDKLLEYATVAGQLGVKGTANILAFTEALAKLETASDITGEEGGSNIARLLTLVDGGVQNVKAFGDEIVNLGNNFAATEAEILENATQIAQNVGIYKIGRQEVLAFATATKSVGIEAELVGSTFGRTLGQFEKIIRTGKGLADLLKIVGGNEKELAQRFKTDASGVFVDYIRGLNNINKAGGSVNAALAKTGVVAIRDQRVIASLASNGFDVLTDAMNKASDAAGAMDQEFATKAASLENQLGRISTAWNNLVLSIENGQGVLGRSASWMAGQLADLLEWVNKLVTATSANEFITRFNPFSSGQASADAIRNANTALRETVDIINQVRDVDLSSANAKALTEQISLMDGALQAAHKQIEATDKAIKEGLLKEGSGEGLKRATSDLEQLKRAAEQLLSTKPAETVSEVIDPNTEELTKEQQRAREAALKAQRDLQKQIDEMNRASLRATLDKDEQEVESVREKYRKIRQEIDAFRKDPKNKGLAVDASGLGVAESREVAQVRYRQETAELVKSLGVQRELWQEYESWRMELGEKSARQRYSNELSVIDNFKANIKREIASIGAQLTAALTGGPAAATLTGAESERLKQLQELLKQITDQEQKQRDADLKEALSSTLTYQQRRLKIIEDSEKKISKLSGEQREIARKQREEALNELNVEHLEANKVIMAAFNDLDDMSVKTARNAVKAAKDTFEAFLKEGKLTAREIEALRKIFDKLFRSLENDVNGKAVEGLSNIASELSNIGSIVGQIDDGFGRWVDTIANVIGGFAKIKTSIEGMKEAQRTGNTMQGVTSFMGVYGAILGAVGGIFSNIINNIAAKQEAEWTYRQEQQRKQTEALNRVLEYQLRLVNDLYGVDRLERYKDVLDEITRTQEQLAATIQGRILNVGDQYTDQLIADINSGKTSIEQLEKSVLDMRKEADNMVVQSGSDAARRAGLYGNAAKIEEALARIRNSVILTGDETVEELKSIYGQLDEGTIQQIERLDELETKFKDVLNELKAELTGTTFEGLLSDVTNLFFNAGENAADAWAAGFEKIMENFIIQTFTRDFLEKKVQEFYDMFYEFSKDGLDMNEKGLLQDFWGEMRKEGEEIVSNLKEIVGLEDKNDPSSNTLQGAYARASQESIDLLAGQTGAMRLHLYELVKLASANNNNTVSQIDIMNGQLNALIAIERNTGVTAVHSKEYLPYLKGIEANTKSSLAIQLRGAGIYNK